MKRKLNEAEATISRLEKDKRALADKVDELTEQLEHVVGDKDALDKVKKKYEQEISELENDFASEEKKRLNAERELKKLDGKLKEAIIAAQVNNFFNNIFLFYDLFHLFGFILLYL